MSASRKISRKSVQIRTHDHEYPLFLEKTIWHHWSLTFFCVFPWEIRFLFLFRLTVGDFREGSTRTSALLPHFILLYFLLLPHFANWQLQRRSLRNNFWNYKHGCSVLTNTNDRTSYLNNRSERRFISRIYRTQCARAHVVFFTSRNINIWTRSHVMNAF